MSTAASSTPTSASSTPIMFDIIYGASSSASPIVNRSRRARHPLPSLRDLTSAKIASSWHITRASLSTLPRDLFDCLLRHACEALLDYKPGAPGLCLMHIIQNWPDPVVKLGAAVSERKGDLKKGNKIMTELLMHVMNGACQSEDHSKLAVLDFSDIPMNGDLCIKILQKVTSSNKTRAVTIILDLTIDEANYKSMKKLLIGTPSVRVKCHRLIMNSLGKDRLAHIMGHIDKEVVKGLALDLNRLENKGFAAMLSVITKFHNLRALNLSYNLINTRKDRSLAQTTAKAFSNLHHLTRLSLSHNIFTGSLRSLLESLNKPLEALYVCGCKLSLSDFAYLANCRHVKSLKELDLSSNNLGSGAVSLEKLLQNAGITLEFLGLDDTHLNIVEYPVSLWTRVSHQLRTLIAVSMRGNGLRVEDQVAILKPLSVNALNLIDIGVCMKYESFDEHYEFLELDEWEIEDRINYFYQLYHDNSEEERYDGSTQRGPSMDRSLMIHDLDVPKKRESIIFIYNLRAK